MKDARRCYIELERGAAKFVDFFIDNIATENGDEILQHGAGRIITTEYVGEAVHRVRKNQCYTCEGKMSIPKFDSIWPPKDPPLKTEISPDLGMQYAFYK